jgi:RNA polymerase sigma-70 factor, ECF subfamily
MQAGLVERARAGDQDAFAALVATSLDRSFAIAYRILRDVHRAQDATQQAYLNAWRDFPALREPDRFEAWLHRLVVRACYAEADRERRWPRAFG